MSSNTSVVKQEKLSILPGRSSGGHLINTSVDFTVNHVDKELHPAFSDSGYSYDSETDRFAPETVATHGNQEQFEYQAFKDELQNFTETARLPNTIRTDLIDNCTWDDLIEQVNIARDEYRGIDKTGIVKSIRNGFKNFAAAAPAMEQWLHLLPSTSSKTILQRITSLSSREQFMDLLFVVVLQLFCGYCAIQIKLRHEADGF